MMMEDMLIIGGLIGVQLVYAANSVLVTYLMSIGLTPFTIIIFFTFATFLVVSPIAFYFERSKWPKKWGLKLTIELVLIAFGGVTLFQWLLLKGMKLTSAAMGMAMPNLAPALIFVIAWILRIETVDVRCVYSKIKMAGTAVCVAGALTMTTMMHQSNSNSNSNSSEKTWEGWLYLVGSVAALSSSVVVQAQTLRSFPAPISVCALTSFIGLLFTAALQLLNHGTLLHPPLLVSLPRFIAYSLLGGAVSGGCASFNGWAINKRGPVVVSVFNPISTLCSLLLSHFTLHQTITIGSLAGMVVMFTGLYLVLWAKRKEPVPPPTHALRKPLLT